jgi:hypothetical protein
MMPAITVDLGIVKATNLFELERQADFVTIGYGASALPAAH